jgi:hypothetical protein
MYSSGYDQSLSRSPIAHQNQPQTGTLHRMPSRQFDAYGQGPQGPNMYAQDDHQRTYDQPRTYERLNQTMHAGGYGYDMGAPQGWNTNAFSQNGGGLGSLGGAQAARIKSQQRGGGRSALPSVREVKRRHMRQDTDTHA